MPRVAFLGTSAFGADVLRRLAAEPGIDVVAVLTQPDRPSGRGRREQSPPVAAAARELGLTLVQTATASAEPPDADVGAVVAFGQMVRPPLLGAYPLYNLHPSLLPRWRGAAPVERAIMAGDAETGVCVIDLTAELDAGPVHGCERFPIGPDDDAAAVRARALDLGAPLLAAALTRGDRRGRAGRGRRDLRAQDRACRPPHRLERFRRAGGEPRARALAAHRRALRARRRAGHGLARPGRRRRRRAGNGDGAPSGGLRRRRARPPRGPGGRQAADAGRAFLRGLRRAPGRAT